MAQSEYTTTPARAYPEGWQIAQDFDPNDHMMSLKGRDYLNVQSRMVWFIKDQRALIAAGLATHPFRIDSELVELDREKGWAHFRAIVVDVLGNTSTAYGSESVKDFGDFIEKAATKALGRALIGLGYGTQYAPEISEGEEARPADSPVERRPSTPAKPPMPPTPAASAAKPAPAKSAAPATAPAQPASEWKALSDADVLKTLNHMQIRGPEAAQQYLGKVKAAMAKAGLDWNKKNLTEQLVLKQRAYDEQAKADAERDLSKLKVGVRGM